MTYTITTHALLLDMFLSSLVSVH